MSVEKFDRKNEIRKIIFQYATVSIAALLIGIYLACIISNGMILSFGEEIKKHFLTDIKKDRLFDSIMIYTVYYSLSDVLCIILGFCFTFSVFNYLACDIILIFKNFCVGLSSAVFYRCVSQYGMIGYIPLIIFIAFKLVSLTLIAVFLCGLSAHSVDLKIFLPNHRFRLDIKAFILIAAYTVCGIGTVFLLNAVYCIMIYIF